MIEEEEIRLVLIFFDTEPKAISFLKLKCLQNYRVKKRKKQAKNKENKNIKFLSST